MSACSCRAQSFEVGAAVDEDHLNALAGEVRRRQHVLDLQGDRLDRGARKVLARGRRSKPLRTAAAWSSHHGAPRPAKAGTRDDAVVRAAPLGERERLARRDPQHAGQPDHGRSCRQDVALEGERPGGRPLPGDGTDEPVTGGTVIGQETHHRGAGAVGRLDLSGRPHAVREEGGVRVAEHRADRGSREARRSALMTLVGSIEPATRGRTSSGMPKKLGQLGEPSRAVARSSSWVRLAFPASTRWSPVSAEASHASTVPAAIAAPGGCTVAEVVDEPRETSVRRTSGRCGSPLTPRTRPPCPWCVSLAACALCAPVLPPEHRTERATGAAIPDHRRLALGADARRRPRDPVRRRGAPDRLVDAGEGCHLRPARPSPGRGCLMPTRTLARWSTEPSPASSSALVALVPWSTASTSGPLSVGRLRGSVPGEGSRWCCSVMPEVLQQV